MPLHPRTIVAVTSDLFLQSRIAELAGPLGFSTHFAADSEELKRTLAADTVLVILDLSSTDYDPFAITQMLKTTRPSLRILGFYPHVKTDLKTRGEEASIDVIVPNSKFLTTLGKLLAEEAYPRC